jgi:hypothetical protein
MERVGCRFDVLHNDMGVHEGFFGLHDSCGYPATDSILNVAPMLFLFFKYSSLFGPRVAFHGISLPNTNDMEKTDSIDDLNGRLGSVKSLAV